MKNKISVLVALMALPAVSFGFSPTLSIQGPGGATGATIEPNVPWVEQLTVIVDNPDGDLGVGAMQFALDAGAANDMFKYMSGLANPPYDRTTGTYLHVYDETGFLFPLLGYTSDPDGVFGYSLSTPVRMSPGEFVAGWAAGETLAQADEMEWIPKTQGANATPANIFPANVITYKIGTDGLDPGTYVLGAAGRGGLFHKVCSGTDCVFNVPVAGYTLTVLVPEPLSALLLLGVIPMLRRRR